MSLCCVTGGQALFRDFLKSEFCEENLDFWLTCQEFRSLDGPEELRREATRIYEEFVKDNANRQVTSEGLTGIFEQQRRKTYGNTANEFINVHLLRIYAII